MSGFLRTLAAVCIGVGAFVCETGRASDLSDLETLRILGARSIEEVSRATRAAEELTIARATCDAQLKAARIPSACFRTVELETRLQLINHERAAAAHLSLADICRERTRKATRLAELEAAYAEPAVRGFCRESVRSRMEELRYMSSDRGSADLFAARFLK